MLNPFTDNLAWLWDIIAMVISLAIVMLVVQINGQIQKSGKLPTYVTRKIVHILVAPVFLITWLFFSGGTSSRYIAMIVPSLFVVQFAGIGLGKIKDEAFVRSMSRSGDPAELLKGTLYYAIVIVLTTIFWFYIPTNVDSGINPGAFIIIGCLAGGDGFADIVGRKFGGKKYGIGGSEKTIAGAIGMLFGSIIFSLSLLAIFSFNIGFFILPVIIISLIATVVEFLTPPNWDNLTIPLCVVLLLVLFSLLFQTWWTYPILSL